MKKIGNEIKYDLNFLKSHTLQPKWYKILKILILLGLLLGYYFIFGLVKTTLFFACFVFFSLIIHYTYRIKTRKYTQNWLDFTVPNDNESKPGKFGKYYYPALIVSVIISFIINQVFIK